MSLISGASGGDSGSAAGPHQLGGEQFKFGPPLDLVPGPAPANGAYYDCEVVEHLHLTKDGYRSEPIPDLQRRRQVTIDKKSGNVQGQLLPYLDWERIKVVKASSAYNVFMTKGYGADGTPVKEVVLTALRGVTQFVSIDLLSDLDVLDGTCK